MVASGYYSKINSNRTSVYGIVVTAIIHAIAVFIFLCMNRASHSSIESQPLIQMIKLKSEAPEALIELQPPSINFQLTVIQNVLPVLDIKSSEPADLTRNYLLSETPYELPDKNADMYKDVFDPKLRKKLIEAQVFNKPRKIEKSKSWTEADGRTFIDVGDGNCLVSMNKVDARDRGTNWGMTRCGKTDSKKMMDNVEADLEARKHPLK